MNKQATISTLKGLKFCETFIHQRTNWIKLLRSYSLVLRFYLRVSPEVIQLSLLRS